MLRKFSLLGGKLKQKKAAGQLTKAEMHRMERILCKLEEYQKAPEFESVKATFDSEEEQREQMADKTLETLNHCFESGICFRRDRKWQYLSRNTTVMCTALRSCGKMTVRCITNTTKVYFWMNCREEILEQMDAVENVVERGLVED